MIQPSNRLLSDRFWYFCTPSGFEGPRQFLVSQYEAGTSSIELGRVMGISHPAIRRKLREYGVSIRGRGGARDKETRLRIGESVRLAARLRRG